MSSVQYRIRHTVGPQHTVAFMCIPIIEEERTKMLHPPIICIRNAKSSGYELTEVV